MAKLINKKLQRVINFSGGRTSGKMTIDEYKPGDIVLFTDTGREHEKTYKFINDFERFEKIPVTRISYEGGFEGMLAKHKYKRIPNRMKRICTVELKIRTAKRYLKSQGILKYENLIGFRFDEPKRVYKHKEIFKKVKTRFPLFEKGITKNEIMEFWKQKPYDLEIPSILGNCTLCFMKGQNAILAILSQYPELAEPWINDENEAKKTYGHTYFKGITIERLLEISQNNLFKDLPLEDQVPAFNCACTV